MKTDASSVTTRKKKKTAVVSSLSLLPPCQCWNPPRNKVKRKATLTWGFATVLLLGIPAVSAAPVATPAPSVLSPRQQQKQRLIEDDTPTAVLDYQQSLASLYGSSSPHSSSSPPPPSKRLIAKIYGPSAQGNLRDNAQVTPDSSSTTPDSSATNNVNIPDGWIPVKRATGFYHVPVIIALSVILSTLLAVLIVGSVFWRKQRRSKRKAAAGQHYDRAEKGVLHKGITEEGNGLRRIVRKIRRTRRGGKRGGGSVAHKPDSGGGGLVGTSEAAGLGTARRSGSVRSRISTATIAAATTSRPSSLLTRTTTNEVSTVAVSQSQSRSSSSPSPTPSLFALQRTVSRTSILSRTSTSANYPAAPSSPNLGPPDDDSTDSTPLANSPPPVSPFGSYFPIDVALPTPGPPAYRPNSSTVRRTSRLTESVLPLPSTSSSTSRPVVGSDDTIRTIRANHVGSEGEEEDIDEWHWPNEKRGLTSLSSTSPSPPPPHATSSRLSPSRPDLDAEGGEEIEEEEEVDRSKFVAHIATDDKATLARLRLLASTSPMSRRVFGAGEASAPGFEEDLTVESTGHGSTSDEEEEEVDSRRDTIKSESTSFLLPPPSRPLNYSSSPSSTLPLSAKEKEIAANALPTYVHGEGRSTAGGRERIGLEVASAPPLCTEGVGEGERGSGSDEDDLYA